MNNLWVFGFLCVCIVWVSVSVAAEDGFTFPRVELAALNALFTSARGWNWTWESYKRPGIKWNFSQPNPNPCSDTMPWLGVECSSNCQASQCNVIILGLIDYNLNGYIPPEIGNFSELLALDLSENILSRTIPATIVHLKKLIYLGLSLNHLTGPIPDGISNLSSLTTLYMFLNMLSGSLPDGIGNITTLAFLDLDTNRFTGTIPSSFGTLPQLSYFYVNNNLFTGAIPYQLGMAVSLQYVALYNNLLSGTIPSTIGNLASSYYFDCGSNQLTGKLPPQLGNMSMLEILGMSNNEFTGSIPASLGNCAYMLELTSFYNCLTGTIPLEIWNLRNVSTILLNNNYLSGELSYSPKSMSKLQFLSLSVNVLSGSIPPLMAENVIELSLDNNVLSHSISTMLGSASSTIAIYLFNNHLTGSIPPDLFQSGATLVLFAAYDNCLTGSIPSTICNLPYLGQLVLDGMGTSRACRDLIFPRTSNQAYAPRTLHAGTIPACLLQLPYLQTLHLSGLMLEGTIPSISSLPTNLEYLSLSYNKLEGAIPEVYSQHSHWKQLDLSFNKLSGLLYELNTTSSSWANVSVKLDSNRLSGRIPSSFLNLSSINLLNGNMWTCNFQSDNLPESDPNRESYSCGSDNMDASLYAWMCCVAVALGLLCYFGKERWQLQLQRWLHPFQIQGSRIEEFQSLVQQIIKLIVSATFFSVIILMPMYAIFKATGLYGTYTVQYAWVLSACFLSGTTPAVLLYFAWNCILGVVIYQSRSKANHAAATGGSKGVAVVSKWTWAKLGLIIIIVSCVNAVYVYGLQQNVNRNYKLLMTLALSMFKFVLESIAMNMLRYLHRKALLAVLIYSHVIAPFVAELFISTDCFYYAVLQNSPSVSSTFYLFGCHYSVQEADTCNYNPTEVNYDPPFVYSYQCSSSLVTNFAYVFVLRYAFPWLMAPLQSYGINIFRKIKEAIPCLLCSSGLTVNLPDLMINMLLDLAILLTFGVVFPPLAVVIFCTMIFRLMQVRVDWKQLEEDSATNAIAQSQIENLVSETTELKHLLASTLLYLSIVAAVFWSFFLFDMMGGSSKGVDSAIALAVVMCISPLIWFGGFTFMNFVLFKKPAAEFKEEDQTNPIGNEKDFSKQETEMVSSSATHQ